MCYRYVIIFIILGEGQQVFLLEKTYSDHDQFTGSGDISLKHYLILGKKYLLLDQLYKSILSQQWQNALLWRQTFNKTKGEIKLFKKYLTLAAQGKKKSGPWAVYIWRGRWEGGLISTNWLLGLWGLARQVWNLQTDQQAETVR